MKKICFLFIGIALIAYRGFCQQSISHYSFTNEQGESVRLSGFKGKVMIIDFWYTGCGGCAYFFKNVLSKIENQLHSDTNVVFLSISTDKDRSAWLHSVQSGVYTNDMAVNLYTGGHGFKHDMLVQQRVGIYPHLQIVDKSGNLVALIRRPYRLGVDTLLQLIQSYW